MSLPINDPERDLELLKKIANLLGTAYDNLYEAGILICAREHDQYNIDFVNSMPQSGYKRMMAQVHNQHRAYKQEYLYALYDMDQGDCE